MQTTPLHVAENANLGTGHSDCCLEIAPMVPNPSRMESKASDSDHKVKKLPALALLASGPVGYEYYTLRYQ